MPADYVGGLSSIDRAQWVKASRRQYKEAARESRGQSPFGKDGVIRLSSHSTGLGTSVRSLQMLYAPGQDGATDGIAVVSVSGDSAASLPRLKLFEFRHSSYLEVTDRFAAARSSGAAEWIFNGPARTITGGMRLTSRTGTGGMQILAPTIEFHWNGLAWVQRQSQSPAVR